MDPKFEFVQKLFLDPIPFPDTDSDDSDFDSDDYESSDSGTDDDFEDSEEEEETDFSHIELKNVIGRFKPPERINPTIVKAETPSEGEAKAD